MCNCRRGAVAHVEVERPCDLRLLLPGPSEVLCFEQPKARQTAVLARRSERQFKRCIVESVSTFTAWVARRCKASCSRAVPALMIHVLMPDASLQGRVLPGPLFDSVAGLRQSPRSFPNLALKCKSKPSASGNPTWHLRWII